MGVMVKKPKRLPSRLSPTGSLQGAASTGSFPEWETDGAALASMWGLMETLEHCPPRPVAGGLGIHVSFL